MEYKKIKKLRNRNLVYLIVITVLVILLVLFFTFNAQQTFMEFIYQLLSSAAVALMTIVLVDLNHKKAEEEEHDEYIKKAIWGLLRAKDANIIKDLYNETAVDEVMGNCLSVYCSKLSSSYLSYIKNNLNIIKKDFDYKVFVQSANTEFEGSYNLTQALEYTRFFKCDSQDDTYWLKCYFAMKPGVLDTMMQDNSFFFREEILFAPFVNALKQLNSKMDVIKALHFDASFNNKKVSIDNIIMTKDDNGICFEIAVSKENIHYEQDNSDKDGFVYYRGGIECSYPTASTDKFYCVFADPTIGKTNFEISFDRKIVSDINNVDRVTLLALPSNEYSVSNNFSFNSIVFKTEGAIFPRSGLYINW